MPWLVYSLGETEYLTDFYVHDSSISIDFGETEYDSSARLAAPLELY